MNKILIAGCLCLLCIGAWAQEVRVTLVGLEAGVDGVIGTVPKHEYIRAETSFFGEAEKNLRSINWKAYAGVIGEIRSLNNKFGFSGGLRFTQINSSLGKDNYSYYSSSASDFFYFMVAQTDNSIEYLKVKEINEASNYIGVPLSVKWIPFGEHLFNIYFKGGLEFNYRVSSKTDVVFVNEEMNQYNDAVTDQLRDTQKLVSIFSTSVGLKIGRNPKVFVSGELGPSVFLNSRTSSIVDVSAGFGGQINLHLTL